MDLIKLASDLFVILGVVLPLLLIGVLSPGPATFAIIWPYQWIQAGLGLNYSLWALVQAFFGQLWRHCLRCAYLGSCVFLTPLPLLLFLSCAS